MKLLHLTATLLLAAATLHAQGIPQPRPLTLPADTDIAVIKDAGRLAIADVLAAFTANEAASGGKSYIILPLGRDIDQGYFTLQFENAFTQKAKSAGYKLYTRADSTLEKVLTEIGFQQNYGDSLEKSTVQKLALVGAQAVVLPRIDIDRSVNGALTLRASISVHNVASGEKTWGDEASQIIPGKYTTADWVRIGAIALAILGGLVILLWFIRSVRAAARPR
ncbi:hypothetical protein [Prosthecobacter sp.]|uniref:hypothetical protein n=1 Tax=Prosthecobacter sp. TaxID=1965333 RepID=UPI0037846201